MVNNPSINAADLLNRGMELMSERNYPDALAYFDGSLIIDPQNVDAWRLKGLAHAENQEFGEAISSYAMVLAIDPKSAQFYNELGCIYDDMGRNMYLWHWPPSNVGITSQAILKYYQAIAFFNSALNIDPNYADAWNNKGITLFYLGKLQEALECVNKAIALKSNFLDALENKKIIIEHLSGA